MAFTKKFAWDERSGSSGKSDLLATFHLIGCGLCTLLCAYLLVLCCISFSGALHDLQKYEYAGSFLHFLGENDFWEFLCVFLLMVAEFRIYVVQCRRAEEQVSFLGSILYFSVLLLFHGIVLLHANSLSLPDVPPYTAADSAGFLYRSFAILTILPSVLYWVLYLLRVWKSRSVRDD